MLQYCWYLCGFLAFQFVYFTKEIEKVAAVICLIGYVIMTMSYVRIYKVVKYHQNQIYWQN